MKRRILSAFACLFPLFFQSCATTMHGVDPANPAVTQKMNAVNKSTMASVIIYRERAYLGSALRPTVMLNGKDFVNVGNGRVFVGAFHPGHYVFQMDDKKSGSELDLKPGQAVYMKVELVPGFWKGGGRLMQIAPEQGRFEAQRLEPMPAKEIEIPSYR